MVEGGGAVALAQHAGQALQPHHRHQGQVEDIDGGGVGLELRVSGAEGEERRLGWGTVEHSSSAGDYLTTAAYGHTGFTGTSIWVESASAS